MTYEVLGDVELSPHAEAERQITQAENDLPPWTVRDVDADIRHRMKVQAAIKGMTMGELVSKTLRSWLDAGAPKEW